MNPKNKEIVKELSTALEGAQSVVVTDYRGLTHKQLEDMRKTLKKAGAGLTVVKNSLLHLAFPELKEKMTGPTAIVYTKEGDVLAPLRELAKAIKTLGLPKIKLALIENIAYDENQALAIAKLPGKEVLQAQVVGGLKSPIYGLVYTLNGNLQKLVYVLSQIKK